MKVSPVFNQRNPLTWPVCCCCDEAMASPTWSPLILAEAPSTPEALRDVLGLLERLVAAYNARTIAHMLDVHPAMLTRWRAGTRVSPVMAARIIDLHDVLNRALQIFAPATAAQWLVGSEPQLGARALSTFLRFAESCRSSPHSKRSPTAQTREVIPCLSI